MRMPKRINETSKRIARAVAQFRCEHEYPPSLRDIGVLTDISSTSIVREHLLALEREGYVLRDHRVTRSMRLTEAGEALSE